MKLLAIGFGGSLGAILRYLFSICLTKPYFYHLGIGTLAVNSLGCFIMGVLFGILSKSSFHSDPIVGFIVIGFLGSFTTFSTFTTEIYSLFVINKNFIAILYIFINIILCLFVFYLGDLLGRLLKI